MLQIQTISKLVINLFIGIIFGIYKEFLLYYQVVFKRKKKVRNIINIVSDCFLVTSFVIIFIIMLYYANNGKFRIMYLISLILGYFVYILLFSKMVRKLIRLINTLTYKLLSIILRPIIKVVLFCIKTSKKLFIFFSRNIAKLFKRRYNKEKDEKAK